MTIDEMFDELENKVRDTYIVTLKYKYDFEENYTIENHILEYDSVVDSYVWLNDWNEGQNDVEVLGYMLLGDVDTTKLEPCEDCVSRDAVEKITWEEPSYDDALNVLTEVRDKVRALPSVEPQRPNGEWIIDDDFEHHNARCNKCGNIIDSRLLKWYPQRYAYCSSCGAKMKEGGNDET